MYTFLWESVIAIYNLQPKDLEDETTRNSASALCMELYSLLAAAGGGKVGDDANDKGNTVGQRSVVDVSRGGGCGTSS